MPEPFFSTNKTFAADAFLWLVNFWKLQARAFFLAHIYQSKQATISDQSLNLSLYKVTKVTKGPRDAIWALSWRLSNSIFFYKKYTFYAKCMLVGLFQKNRYKKKNIERVLAHSNEQVLKNFHGHSPIKLLRVESNTNVVVTFL